MGYYDVTVTLTAAGYVLYTSGVYTFCGSTCLHGLRKLYASRKDLYAHGTMLLVMQTRYVYMYCVTLKYMFLCFQNKALNL